MEITASTKVNIDEKTQKQICIGFLRSVLNFHEDYSIKDGKVIDSYSYRSWVERDFVRDATEQDLALDIILKALNKK